jgi:hypothetical protein
MRRAGTILAAGLALVLSACTAESPPPAPLPPPSIPSPSPPPAPGPAVCDATRAGFVIGDEATTATVQRATLASGARVARVISPGEAVTMEFSPDRLTIRVNRRNRIVNLTCG